MCDKHKELQLMLSFSITLAQPSACLYVHSTICLCIFLFRLFNFGTLNVRQKCLAIFSGCCPRFSIGVIFPKISHYIIFLLLLCSHCWGCILQLFFNPTLHKPSSHVSYFSSQLYNLPCFAFIQFQEPHSLCCNYTRENH